MVLQERCLNQLTRWTIGMINNYYACPCCGEMVFESVGEHDICPNCNWEDDPFQSRNPDRKGGANKMSLNEAKDAYRKGKAVI
ncbi:CPCC family cysteine-rich protein [Citrobacter sp. RHBSTW-00986]|uniref:CPCC family cysteine-rich protein n=2 Tax=Gammaproteobacteria TaxID=1236 RepID=UPI00351A487C